MTDFLLELRSEEIPARMQAGARESLARLFAAELAKAGLVATETVTYATPRRLALIARGLPDGTEAVREEIKGPKTSAPTQALEGFLRKTGLTREQLIERDGILFAVTERPGRATVEVIAEAVPAVIRAFPWPKSMRWGAASTSTESLRWVRPLQGIVALFGDAIVPCEIAGVVSGAATVGRRFHHPGAITIGSAADYVEKLREAHVIVDQDERQSIIALGATMATAKAGLTLIRDEWLLIENAGLTEWPVPLLGRFDAEYLSVPPEVIQLTARVNQKYFVCNDADGKLANAFVCTANIDASDGGATIVEGNRKVLAARLSDARFFYDTDVKVPLADQAKKLDRIVFHEKLGTVADKVDRVAKLARWLVDEGIVKSSPSLLGEGDQPQAGGGVRSEAERDTNPSTTAFGGGPPPRDELGEDLAALAERAARLCKADLVTGMVGEFPELQGVMGGYYATAQGEDPRVAAAIRDHYKPVGQGDAVPTDPVTVAVSLAERIDGLVAFFGEQMKPTGSKDPFALRRLALGVIAIALECGLRFPLKHVLLEARYGWLDQLGHKHFEAILSDLRMNHDRAFDSWAELQVAAERDHPHLFDIMDRSQALSAQHNITDQQLRTIAEAYVERFVFVEHQGSWQIVDDLLEFFADRLKVQQREAGVRHDLIDAVFALGGEDDLVRLLARVHALQAFVGTPDGANLLAGYKRAANILKKKGFPSPLQGRGWPSEARSGEGTVVAALDRPLSLPPTSSAPSLSPEGERELEPADAALIAALDAAEPAAASAVAREDFAAAMTALATLRAPIDAFFETVTVNDPDPEKRAARLALLARVRAAVHNVADFSKIEG